MKISLTALSSFTGPFLAAGLKEIVAEVLQPALTTDLIELLDRAIDGRRVLLLLDGLDEWSDEQAARTTLQYILTFVTTYSVPTVATARPRGLDKLGAIPTNWRIAELAPLSVNQQRKLAGVWFGRSTARSSEEALNARSPIEARLDRFFIEIARDRKLSILAGNPLLLVGLIALSLRQVALPRNKTHAIQTLVGILIETHPEQRATASGDTKARFVSIPDIEDRRAALRRLAFAGRSVSGGGTYDIRDAKKTIRDYLVDPTTFGYSAERAQNAAGEILAVNSETIGLLAERASGEVGFAHSMFEEFLAAEYIQGWPFDEIISYVREKSGSPLWRNVISNLISLLTRQSEVESLVAVIENSPADARDRLGNISRDLLLSDIAFGTSRIPPTTAQRLIDRAFAIVERGDWLLVRREVLKSALTSVGDSVVPMPVDNRMRRWAPRREKYLSDFFHALGDWPPTEDLCDVLIGGLYDEERSNQRSAAQTLGRLFKARGNVQQRLRETLNSTLELSVTAAVLEALAEGWPATPELSELQDKASISQDPLLRLVGISGRASSGRANATDRDALVILLYEFSELHFGDQPTARMLLSKYWPNDSVLIELALDVTRRSSVNRDQFSREAAMYYLVSCSPSNLAVVNWLRSELRQEYPFTLVYDGIWDYLAPFALAYDDIRTAVIAVIKSEHGRLRLYNVTGLIHALTGDELRDILIEIATNGRSWGEYWAVRSLLEGWGETDPIVAEFLDSVASWDNSMLDDLAEFLPKIIKNTGVCRARLLSLARNSEKLILPAASGHLVKRLVVPQTLLG